ncbi:hypothetical protein DFH27DRAFT_525081 [Peziza echinospora]|nr:hypothetical protein DFH27DRAFT_525081 [Peziza echinospora]
MCVRFSESLEAIWAGRRVAAATAGSVSVAAASGQAEGRVRAAAEVEFGGRPGASAFVITRLVVIVGGGGAEWREGLAGQGHVGQDRYGGGPGRAIPIDVLWRNVIAEQIICMRTSNGGYVKCMLMRALYGIVIGNQAYFVKRVAQYSYNIDYQSLSTIST